MKEYESTASWVEVRALSADGWELMPMTVIHNDRPVYFLARECAHPDGRLTSQQVRDLPATLRVTATVNDEWAARVAALLEWDALPAGKRDAVTRNIRFIGEGRADEDLSELVIRILGGVPGG